MADTGADMLRAFADDEKLMARLEKAVFGAANGYSRSVTNAMDDAIGDLLTDADGLVRPTKENVKILEAIDRQIPEIIEDNGLRESVQQIRQTYERRLDTLDRLVDQAGIEGAKGIDFRRLPEIENEITKFTSQIEGASPEVQDIVRNEMLKFRTDINSGSAVRFGNLRETLITKANILPRYAGTVGNTQLAAIDRVGRSLQADKVGISKFRYTGVLDGLTRPFCRQWLGEVRERKFWEGLKNNVDPQPAMKYCGGWNCRHRLLMWRDEWDNPNQAELSTGGSRRDKILERAKKARGYNITDPATQTASIIRDWDNELKQDWSKKVEDTFTDTDFEAIKNYTGGAHSRINGELRDVPLEDAAPSIRRDIEKIDDVFKKDVADIDEDMVTYRGLDRKAMQEIGIPKSKDIDQLKKMLGMRINDDGFMSTSINPAIARGFAGDTGVVMKVFSQRGQKAIYTSVEVDDRGANFELSQHMREKEFMMPRSEQLELIDVEERHGKVFLLARRIPADE